MRRTRRKLGWLAALAAIALVAVGCGGDDDGEATTTGTATGTPTATDTATETATPPVELSGEVSNRGTATASGDSLAVELGDFYFDPTFIQGEPGSSVTLELSNVGSAAHTFTIDDQNVDVSLEPEGSDSVEVTFPESGSVRFYCRFHAAQGMQGALFVGG